MRGPTDILESVFQRVASNVNQSAVSDPDMSSNIELVCRSKGRSGACTRLLLAGSLAKAARPEIDIRKPYTEIKDTDSYSGRAYDERYISAFINQHRDLTEIT